jgi:hypothetical protein
MRGGMFFTLSKVFWFFANPINLIGILLILSVLLSCFPLAPAGAGRGKRGRARLRALGLDVARRAAAPPA